MKNLEIKRSVNAMGILKGIFKSRDKPKNATSGSAYRFFIGGSSIGKNVNERSAMQMTAVYSCVRILSEAVASLPLHVYKYNSEGGKGEIIALYPLMPNRMTVDRDDKGQLYYQYNTSKDDAPTMKGSMVNLKPSDVLHIPGLGFGHCLRRVWCQVLCKWCHAGRYSGGSGNRKGSTEGQRQLDFRFWRQLQFQ